MGDKQRSFSALFSAAQAHEEYWTERVILEFTEELTQWMELRGVSRKELAERIGSSQPYITKVLKGDVNFTLATMVKLARALGAELRIQLSPTVNSTEVARDPVDRKADEEPRQRERKTRSA
jgi:transcriptional regulator with XRE-family HTH domain